jgi:TRAP-type C4-dicarboxylate transport system permease small subunit
MPESPSGGNAGADSPPRPDAHAKPTRRKRMYDSFYELLGKTEKALNKMIILFTGTILFSLAIIISIQVFCRYILENSLTWSEEITKYMMVWMVFIAVGYVLGKRGHSNIDLVTSKLSPKLRLIVDKCNSVLLICFSCIIIRYGINFVSFGARQKSSALTIPMDYIYVSIPIGGALMLFYSILLLLRGEEKQ